MEASKYAPQQSTAESTSPRRESLIFQETLLSQSGLSDSKYANPTPAVHLSPSITTESNGERQTSSLVATELKEVDTNDGNSKQDAIDVASSTLLVDTMAQQPPVKEESPAVEYFAAPISSASPGASAIIKEQKETNPLQHDPPTTASFLNPKIPTPDGLHRTDTPALAARGIKKLRSSKGKTILVRFPAEAARVYGALRPLSSAEVNARVKKFQEAGYDIRGFGLSNAAAGNDALAGEAAQNRAEFPDPTELRKERETKSIDVAVPDKKKWDDYVNHLTEEKLRALGVSIGGDEGLASSSSRQGASPGPTLSPPGPSSSSASQHQWANAPPFSAPFSPATSTNNTSVGGMVSPVPSLGQAQRPNHLSRQSTYGFPMQGVQPQVATNPPWSFQNFVPEGVIGRGASPAGLQRLPSAFSQGSNDVFVDRQQTPRAQSTDVRLSSDQKEYPLARSASETEPRAFSNPMSKGFSYEPEDKGRENEGDNYGDLAYPAPRGHRHNISETLEREAENTDLQYYPGEYIEDEDIQPKSHRGSTSVRPTSQERESNHRPLLSVNSTASSGRLNVEAEEFKFNPGGSHGRSFSKSAFMPATAKPMVPKMIDPLNPTVSFATAQGNQGFDHSSNFNVNAPSFKPPGQGSFSFSRPGFQFSAKGFEPNQPIPNTTAVASGENKSTSMFPKIFSGLNLADIVKPAKVSKAIPIINPDQGSRNEADADDNDVDFDEDGRLDRSDARSKRSRFAADDGDEVPKFATPTPLSNVNEVKDEQKEISMQDEEAEEEEEQTLLNYDEPTEDITGKTDMPLVDVDANREAKDYRNSDVPWHEFEATSPRRIFAGNELPAQDEKALSNDKTVSQESLPYPSDADSINNDSTLFPSFNEIDAVMEHINNDNLDNSDFGVEPPKPAKYVPPQLRKASSDNQQSPVREPSATIPEQTNVDRETVETWNETPKYEESPQDNEVSDMHQERITQSQQSPVRNLNTYDEATVSDWDDMLPPGEELRIPDRSPLGDPHLVTLVEAVLRRHLDPFERTLKDATSSFKRLSPRELKDSRPLSSYTKSSSDADDEDDDLDNMSQSRVRQNRGDKKLEQIKSAVLEAMNSSQSQGFGHIEQEAKFRKSAEERVEKLQREILLSEKEISLLKEASEDAEDKLRSVEEELGQWKQRHAAVEEELRTKTLDFTAETAALEDTLDEYRTSSNQWRSEIDSLKKERDNLSSTVETLRKEATEHANNRGAITAKLEKMQEELTAAANNLNVERNNWQSKDQENSRKYELLNARFEEEQRIKAKLGAEIERLSEREKEAIRANIMLEEAQSAKIRLEGEVKKLNEAALDHRSIVTRFEQELQDAKENISTEVQRAKSGLESELEVANKKTEHVRADLETRLQITKSELGSARKDAESLHVRYESLLEDAANSRKTALKDAADASNSKMQEERERFERSLKDMSAQHERALHNALEDKQRSDTHNSETMKLANSKVDHLVDKIRHLEDKLAVAQSAAQAAAQAAQSARSSPTPKAAAPVPEQHYYNVTPKALRESIVALQEQLQEREARIETLESKLALAPPADGSAKHSDRDTEVGWLREILNVRLDDLYELIDALSKPDFDRVTARDAAIRIRANIEMEQQDRERVLSAGGNLGPGMNSISLAALKAANATQNLNVPSLADIQNFASPKAAQLAAAWGNWRNRARGEMSSPGASLESLREAINSGTPSKNNSPPTMNPIRQFGPGSNQTTAGMISQPSISLSGLMTPPASNLRKTPTPPSQELPQSPDAEEANLSNGPHTPTRPKSSKGEDDEASFPATTPPLMRKGFYDQDASAVTEIRTDGE